MGEDIQKYNNQKFCSRTVQGDVHGTAFLTVITEVIGAEHITFLPAHANNHTFKALFTNTSYSCLRCYRCFSAAFPY